jgi:hypothetical protein
MVLSDGLVVSVGQSVMTSIEPMLRGALAILGGSSLGFS